MKQITITEENEWENETFSYVLTLDDETILEFKKEMEQFENVHIEENTTYTQIQINDLNSQSENDYMDRYQFCEFEKPNHEFNWYDDVVYKGVGFTRNNK